MRTVHKIAACMLAGTLFFAGNTATARAAETPVAGIDLILTDYNQNPLATQLEIKSLSLVKTEKVKNTLAFAKVDDYVNIRSKPNENGKIVGKLYKDSAATILEKKGDWYKVKSGSVSGYIMTDFLMTGKSAAEFAKSIGTKFATITTTTLRVRQKASTTSQVVTLVPRGEEYKITKEKAGWVKIKINGSTAGYVSTDFVEIKKVYQEAVSIEEEKEQQAIALMATENRTSTEAADHSENGSAERTVQTTSVKKAAIKVSSNGSLRNKIVEFALRFEGNPYVWGGTSLTHGADCSGFTQSIFENYGVDIPRTSREQAASGNSISFDEMQPGDLIFYRRNGTINHVAIYIGNGKVIAAKSPGEGIRITNYDYRTPYKVVSYLG